MGETGINIIDRDLRSQSITMIGFAAPHKSLMTRLLMTGMRNAFNQNMNSFFFAPPHSSVDSVFKKHMPAPKNSLFVGLSYSHEGDLGSYELQNPLTNTNDGSIRRFDSALSSLTNKPNFIFFMFTQLQVPAVWTELKFLQSRRSVPLIIAVAADLTAHFGALPPALDSVMQLSETQAGVRVTSIRTKTSPTPMPMTYFEDFDLDATTDLYVPCKPKPAQLTLAEVDAELYDLRGFDAQRDNSDKVKDLMKRRHELTGTNKRPSFMS